ncbi:uncharacterized protein DDB_G0283697-like [Vespa velutina]|uniref:uncharacterized protein DDB_G0283697-like n=1 Tax=Vespa velutina TaxID=202808 RepID=UPI001FB24A0A|nr:uncharacterized protein DDB_G0283697-like [Vespa velutina]XP_047360475.1 uncharacterized protein DDB_G0283697-like [Vespa velutina]
MNKTESFNLDGSKNPRQPKRKDGSVNTEEEKNSGKQKKKPHKLSLWCGKLCGWRKKNGEKDKRKLNKKSKRKKSKRERYCGFCKRKNKNKENEEEEEEEEEGSAVRVNRAAKQPKMRDKEHQTFDQSDSKTSVEERKKSRAERKKEKALKGKNSGHLEKSVSYAKDNRYTGDQRSKINRDRDRLTGDITKSCCFLCAENSLAIAAAIGPRPICSDKSVDAYGMKGIETSCSPIKLPVHVRTVKSSLRIKVKDTCTSYGNMPKAKKKRKKFKLFPKVKKTTCPNDKVIPKRRTVGCVTENPSKSEKPKEKKINEPCCKDKAT